MNGNWKKELTVLITQNQKYLQVLTKCSLSRHKVKVIYWQCYLPAVTYPLPAAVIPPEKINEEQKPITATFLAKMGYPWTFLQAVAYAPKSHGGIGLCHISAEQGTQKILQVLKHVHVRTTIGTLYQVLIDHYELNSSFLDPILEDMTPIPWSQAYWVDTLRAYLHQINGTISLQWIWTPKAQQTNDKFLMQPILQANLPLSMHDYKILNNVYIHLQANTLSDILNHNRTHLRKECMQAVEPLPNKQQHYHHNHSTIQWPCHANPSLANWCMLLWMIQKYFCLPTQQN